MRTLGSRRRAPFFSGLLLAAPLLLAACGGLVEQAGEQMTLLIADSDGPPLPPATKPSYRSGQRFTYSDGRIMQVVSSQGNEVVWRNADGNSYRTDRNFVVPRLASSNANYQRAVVNDADALWPLQVGKGDRLRVVRSSIAPDGSRQVSPARTYNCRVSGTERLSVPAGSFDTFRVQCARYSSSGKRLIETKVWHYAPSLGHVVRYETIERKSGRRDIAELVSSSG